MPLPLPLPLPLSLSTPLDPIGSGGVLRFSTTLSGRVSGVYETRADGEVLRSPDNPTLRIPATAGEDYTLACSGGFEGMALASD